MSRTRLERWEKPRRLVTFLTGDDSPVMESLCQMQAREMNSGAEDVPRTTSMGIIEACKEIIYDRIDGHPVFYLVLYSFDVDTAEIVLSPSIKIEIAEDSSDDGVESDVIQTLAFAAAMEVPVYANTRELEPELARFHRRLLVEGFTLRAEDGDRKRFKLVRSTDPQADSMRYLRELDSIQAFAPAELVLMREALLREWEELRSAERVLSSLSFAIEGLERLLDETKRNESGLQSWLTDNPILFGTEYSQIIPKHRLGAEYEMDYALVRHSGLVDLVEIEAASLPVYNKNGDPSRHLVHAEQQVLNWIDWIECHGAYARDSLPGAYSPRAFVVIGRSETLSDFDGSRLRRRNIAFKGQVELLTYDDLLERAKGLRQQLKSLGDKA